MHRLIFVFCLLLVALPTHAKSLSEQIEKCAAVDRDEKRLACFDKLAKKEARKQGELTDDVGLRKKEKDEELEESYTVNITACDKSYNRVSFRLENGQVWRQKNEKWMSLRNCEGEGTLSKDFFGYKLYIKAMDKTIRVARLN